MRTASGKESEALDWVGWDVRDLAGKEAQIQIVDRNSGGWGHILADQIVFADEPALSTAARGGSTTAATTTRRCPGTASRTAAGS